MIRLYSRGIREEAELEKQKRDQQLPEARGWGEGRESPLLSLSPPPGQLDGRQRSLDLPRFVELLVTQHVTYLFAPLPSVTRASSLRSQASPVYHLLDFVVIYRRVTTTPNLASEDQAAFHRSSLSSRVPVLLGRGLAEPVRLLP